MLHHNQTTIVIQFNLQPWEPPKEAQAATAPILYKLIDCIYKKKKKNNLI